MPVAKFVVNVATRKKIKLNERTYTCDCGNTMDRDLNAAINIKNEGLRLLKTA